MLLFTAWPACENVVELKPKLCSYGSTVAVLALLVFRNRKKLKEFQKLFSLNPVDNIWDRDGEEQEIYFCDELN